MSYSVYILRSQSSGRLYIGQTQDLSKRIQKHNAGYVKSTKGRGPWSIYFFQQVPSRAEAMAIERKLKNLKSRKRIEAWVEKHK